MAEQGFSERGARLHLAHTRLGVQNRGWPKTKAAPNGSAADRLARPWASRAYGRIARAQFPTETRETECVLRT